MEKQIKIVDIENKEGNKGPYNLIVDSTGIKYSDFNKIADTVKMFAVYDIEYQVNGMFNNLKKATFVRQEEAEETTKAAPKSTISPKVTEVDLNAEANKELPLSEGTLTVINNRAKVMEECKRQIQKRFELKLPIEETPDMIACVNTLAIEVFKSARGR
jgi:hypothetical protein